MADIPLDSVTEGLRFYEAINRLLHAPFSVSAMAIVATAHMLEEKGAAAVLLRRVVDELERTPDSINLKEARIHARARRSWQEAEKIAAASRAGGLPT